MDRALESQLYPTQASPLPSATQVLVFAAHADDEVYGCGGVLRLLVEKGASISVLIVTQGNRCPANGTGSIVARRRLESLEASKVLGYAEPDCWDLPDRELRYTETFINRLCAKITETNPDLIFAPALSEMHPDHQALALSVSEAVRRLGTRRLLAFYEVSAPTTPNALFDISSVLPIKIRAMDCFTSQEDVSPYRDRILALNRYRAYVLGKEAEAAEAFFILESDRLNQGLSQVFESWLSRRRQIGLASDPLDLPLVSIIVRTTGRATLHEALESIAAQTYPNLQVVLVDATGCGSFESGYAERFNLTVASTGTPLSRSQAANLGLSRAAGQYVMFLDEDDLLLPDHVTRLVKALRARRNAKAAYGGVRAVDENGSPIVEYDAPWSVERLLAANFIPIMAVLFERSLIKDGCRFDEAFEVSEDWDFWMQMAQRTPFVHVPGISAVYRYYLGESKLSHERDQNIYLHWRQKVLAKWFRILGIDPFSAALHRLALELDEEKKQKSRLMAETDRLIREKEELIREKEELHREKAALFHQMEETRVALACRIEENQGLIVENQLLRDQVKAFEQERDIFLNSTVWRLTAPLRWLGGALRRLKHRVHHMIA